MCCCRRLHTSLQRLEKCWLLGSSHVAKPIWKWILCTFWYQSYPLSLERDVQWVRCVRVLHVTSGRNAGAVCRQIPPPGLQESSGSWVVFGSGLPLLTDFSPPYPEGFQKTKVETGLCEALGAWERSELSRSTWLETKAPLVANGWWKKQDLHLVSDVCTQKAFKLTCFWWAWTLNNSDF